jgi:hypothetical protein
MTRVMGIATRVASKDKDGGQATEMRVMVAVMTVVGNVSSIFLSKYLNSFGEGGHPYHPPSDPHLRRYCSLLLVDCCAIDAAAIAVAVAATAVITVTIAVDIATTAAIAVTITAIAATITDTATIAVAITAITVGIATNATITVTIAVTAVAVITAAAPLPLLPLSQTLPLLLRHSCCCHCRRHH